MTKTKHNATQISIVESRFGTTLLEAIHAIYEK